MPLVETYPQVSATEAGAHFGRTLDQAARGPVTIRRRGESYVLIRGDQYEKQLAEMAAQAYPRLSLEQLLAGYDKDVHRLRLAGRRTGRQGKPVTVYAPKRGDLVHLNFSPQVGHELAGPHYGLVISAQAYSVATGLAMICPITSKTDKVSGFQVPLPPGGRIRGVVLSSEVRTVDYIWRGRGCVFFRVQQGLGGEVLGAEGAGHRPDVHQLVDGVVGDRGRGDAVRLEHALV